MNKTMERTIVWIMVAITATTLILAAALQLEMNPMFKPYFELCVIACDN